MCQQKALLGGKPVILSSKWVCCVGILALADALQRNGSYVFPFSRTIRGDPTRMPSKPHIPFTMVISRLPILDVTCLTSEALR